MVIRLLVALTLFLCGSWSGAAELELANVRLQIYFSPNGGATEAIVREIEGARSEVLVQAYVLSSQPLIQALLRAHGRGTTVKVLLDKSERGEGMTPAIILANAGVTVLLDNKHPQAHANIIIIDRATVITGSFTFTKAAEEVNADDLLIIKSTDVAREYHSFWENHRAHAELQ